MKKQQNKMRKIFKNKIKIILSNNDRLEKFREFLLKIKIIMKIQ